MEAAKTLVIGLDAADWEILDELMAEDRMPALRRDPPIQHQPNLHTAARPPAAEVTPGCAS